jgi:hypothetical protein
VLRFRAEWEANGQRYNSGWTDAFDFGDFRTIDLNALAIPAGTTIWARGAAVAGEEKNGPKTTYQPDQPQIIEYEATGTTTHLRIHFASEGATSA